jgi:predicted dehydrogenase
MIKVGIGGFGYWGPNLLRVFQENPGWAAAAVSDIREARRQRAKQINPGLRLYESAEELIGAADIEAVAIATPVATHFSLARRALGRGKHVLVEKPLCRSAEEGRELVDLAAHNGLALMVDHTYLFHPAVGLLRRLKQDGALGTISYYDSLRVNLGLFQPDVNVLWDLGPHDFSIMDHILDEEPVHIEASGYCHLNEGIPDIAYVTVHFRSPVIALFNLSWMSPAKARRISIGGSKLMAIWDDLNRDEPLKIYDSGISRQPEDQRGILLPSYRIGDIRSPRIDQQAEPLAGVVEHFRRVIAGQEAPVIDGRRGLRILRMLESAQQSLDRSLAETSRLRRAAPNGPAAERRALAKNAERRFEGSLTRRSAASAPYIRSF